MYEKLLPKRARRAYQGSRHKARLDALAACLLDQGYSTRTVGRHLLEWVDFVAQYEPSTARLPVDVWAPEVVAHIDRRTGRRHSGIGGVRKGLALLLGGDGVADAVRTPPPRGPSSPSHEAYVPQYLEFVRCHRGRRTTRQIEETLAKFFDWLQRQRSDDLRHLKASDVRDFMGAFPMRHRTTVATYASALRGFLAYLRMQGVLESDLAAAVEIPAGYRLSKPPEVWNRETVESLLAAVDRSTALGRRDYAILLLAARCGLRPCDIRGLRFDHVRWRDSRLVFVQAKTRRLLELPLPADVEHALVDYVRQGRPECSAREIFVRHVAPIRPFARNNALWKVVARAFRAADLQPPTPRRGLYVLRHTLATRMLEMGVAIHTIGDVLGHASVDTTRKYTLVNLAALRSVALSESEVRK